MTALGAGRGALLLAFYSAGLAIPFLATSLAFSTHDPLFGWSSATTAWSGRRRDPHSDGHPDVDRPALPAQHRSSELALGARPELLESVLGRPPGGATDSQLPADGLDLLEPAAVCVPRADDPESPGPDLLIRNYR